ncbi:MAG: LamG-like jellyroll fold domain-containing protein [Dysgonomonas sp.]
MKKSTDSGFHNEAPPGRKKRLICWKNVVFTLTFILAFFCTTDTYASREWGSDCFSVSYNSTYGRYEITILIHEAEHSGLTYYNGKLDNTLIRVQDETGNRHELLYINADGDNAWFNGNFTFQYKYPSNSGRLYDTKGSNGTQIESEINGNTRKSINQGYGDKGQTWKVFYWYPSNLFAGKNLKFFIDYGKWNRRMNGDNSISNQWANNGNAILMSDPTSTIKITQNGYDRNGNNKIEYAIDNYNAIYERGQLVLQYSDDKNNWNEIAQANISSTGSFTGKYMPDKKESFTNGGYFRIVKRVNLSDGRLPNEFVFFRYSDDSQSSRKSVFDNFNAQQSDNKINFSWTTSGENDSSNGGNSYELFIKKAGDSWDNAEKIRNINYSAKEYVYTIPNTILGVDKQKIAYEFMIKRSEFDPGANWDKYLAKTISQTINPNYRTLTDTNVEPSGNSIILSWGLTNGVFIKDDFEYIITVPEVGDFYPEIKEGNNTYTLTGLASCKPYNITLSLRLKSSKVNISSHIYKDVMIEDNTPSVVRNFTASKGYHPDKINLRWQVPRDSGNFARFAIVRKIMGIENSEPVIVTELTHVNNTVYNFEDNSIEPGVYYDYSLIGYVECAENNTEYTYSNIGFSQPYGSISGRISYDGKQSVSGVDIIVSGDAGRSEIKNRALEFSAERHGGHHLDIPLKNKFTGSATIQMWISMAKEEADAKTILHIPEVLTFDYKNNSFEVNGQKISGSLDISPLKYQHVSLVLKNEGTETKAVLFLNGNAAGEVSVATGSEQPKNIYIGGKYDPNETEDNLKKTYFSGYVDEIRLWNYSLAANEIKKNYDRYLSGKENGLISYYRCDEPSDIKGKLFDLSAVKSSFNMNDALLGDAISKVDDDNKVPSPEQLAIKGTTDEYGNYLINTIPYSNEGDVFNVTPLYGVHSFSPSSRPVLVGPNSKVHNGIDFTDVSSFSVSGKVTYAETNYPVEGVEFVIDGTTICSKDGEIIKSDKNGNYTISVPIGEHHITARMNGHTFVGKGRYPADPENISKKVAFDKPVTGLNFQDSTLVTIAGRVAGGKIERNKSVGFGIGKANIGQATITLKGTGDYQLNTGSDTKKLESGNKFISSTAEVSQGSNVITIKTCPKTGEFVFRVPPISLKIDNVYTKANTKNDFGSGEFAEIGIINPNQIATDTLTVAGKPEEFKYHKLLNFNYISTPILEVRDMSNNKGAFGEKTIEFINKSGNKEDVDIYTDNNGTIDYKLKYPVFEQLKRYRFELQGYELYQNTDNEQDTVSDRVPLDGCVVTIANEFGIQQVYNEGANDGQIYELSESQVQLDSLGVAQYVFTTGFPNINDDHTLGMNISYQYNDRPYQWDENGKFKAYVFGQLPTGNDYVTEGPDIVSMVLRDPPGSQSYAYFEKGTTMTSSSKVAHYYSGSGEGKNTIKYGATVTAGFGIGTLVLSTVESKIDVTVGLEWEINHSNESGTTNTITTTERISTSESPDYVGAAGDVFIGSSNNRVFGKSRNVGLVKDGNDFSIGVDEVMTIGTRFSTAFKYTANHIENNLIPNYYDMRDNLLIKVSEAEYNDRYPNNTDKPIYITTLDKDDPKFGSDNSDKNVWGDGAVHMDSLSGKSYRVILPQNNSTLKDSILTDKISWCNAQIKMWTDALADNEEIKIEAILNKDQTLNKQKRSENHSFDAGVAFESSKQNCTEKSHEKVHEYTIKSIVGAETGIIVGGLGTIMNIETRNGGGDTFTESGSTENCITTGYVLKDENPTDYYSVDVILPQDNTGAVFSTRGGRSSCPYEGEILTKYFREGSKLSEATMKVEVPSLRVTNPFATSVPSGKEATFELKLSNASEANQDVVYSLRALDETNPNGAKLSIDGSVLTTGRDIFIKAGETLTKTLKLSQTSVDVLQYDSISVVLSSTCQSDIADTVYISAEFVPSCSDISIVIDRRILNVENGDILPVKIKDYILEYKNLKGVQLQYKPITSDVWSVIREFVINSEDKNENNELINSRREINYEYSTSSLPDGTYDVRAVTMCAYGNEIIYNESQTIRIIKDMVPPQSLGQPSPSNGILVPESELSITFNETIQNSLLNDGNFIIEGVLNGYKVKDNVGLSFDGTGNAYTELQVVNNSSLSIEGWFKRQLNAEGTLFSYGTQESSISLGFTGDNKLVVTTGDETFTSQDELKDAGWQYISMAYDRENGNLRAYLLTNQTDINPSILGADKYVSKELPQTGKFYIGSKVDGSNKFKGSVRQVHLWNKERELGDLSDRDAGKGGNEAGLIGYWNLEEGSGDVAADKARGRNLLLNTGWFIYPSTKAVSFNGVDDYLKISNQQVLFTENDDFSIEFWFKGDKQNGVILSAGDTIQNKVKGKLSIASKDNGQLSLKTSGSEYIIASSDVMNNEWHHFAMSVRRQGNTNVYIDGKQTFQTPSQYVGEYSTVHSYLGAGTISESVNESEGEQVTTIAVNDPFKGSIDEVRIWNTSLTGDNFKLDRNNKLTGKESGLVAYYPFEKYTKDDFGQYIIEESLNDQSMNLYKDTVSVLVAEGKVTFTDVTPAIKDVRPKETIAQYSWTASDNKIVINLDEPISRIENCILEFTVQRVMDSNNNRMAPKKWTAFIDLNRMQWIENNLSLEKDVYKPLSFKASISNKGGVNETYSIGGTPSWLKCSAPYGTLKPQQTQEVEFVVDESVEIGKYEVALMLTGNNNYSEPLILSLKVNGEKPDWAVDPNKYSSSMNIVSQVKIENVYQEDTEDIVAAFINGECRGVASPQYVKSHNSYYLFMDVYGNESDIAKDVIFQLWDAGTGRVYSDIETSKPVNFKDNLTEGTFTNPVILNALNVIEQQINLRKGWNWISVNIVARETPLLDIFKTNIGNAGEILKSKTAYIQAPTWGGGLSVVNNEEMYNLRVNDAYVLKFKGAIANPSEHPISLKKGWNWIGYLPTFSLPINSALAGIEAKNGDQIKGQSGFALYVEGNGWLGSLTHMVPGKGYMYQLGDESATLTYPSKMMPNASLKSTEKTDLYWNSDVNKYQDNMTLTSIVKINGEELRDSDFEIALFNGDECRGSARLKYEESLDRYLAYLLVHGEASDVLSFRIYDHTRQEAISSKETITFTANAIYGNPTDPYVIDLKDITGITSEYLLNNISIYPNPASDVLNVEGLYLDSKYNYVIYGADGRIVSSGTVNRTDNTINVSALATSFYIIELSNNEFGTKHQLNFMKK